jgi:uncharacterized protein (DUF302 family)
MIHVEYGFTRTLNNVSCEEAKQRITDALGEEGFGVLTEIDVKQTLQQKLGKDFRKYVILGACSPPIAYQALSADPGVGLLLPCNVVVMEDDAGNAVISMADPQAMVRIMEDPTPLLPMMAEARNRLQRALQAA